VNSLGSGVALLGIGGAMLHASWGHWPDVLVDFGRELYLPWRLSEGEVLYRDVRHLSGPLSPYWNALMFRVFGVGLRSLVWVNVAGVALMVLLLHGLLRRIAGPVSAFVGSAVLLVAFAFGQLDRIGNYNYVTPYAHEVTHGLLLSLAILGVLGARARLGDGVYALAGLLLGAVALTKVEIAVAIGGSVAVFTALSLRADARREGLDLASVGKRLGLLALGGSLVPIAALLLLGRAMPLHDAARALADPWRFALDAEVRGLDFYRRGMGTLAPLESLERIAQWGVYWAVFVGVAVGLALRIPTGRRVSFAIGAGVAAAALFVFRPESATSWLWVSTPLPLAALGWLAFEGVRQWRRPADDPAVRLRIAFAVFATLLTAKIALRTILLHYGFALAMPITLLAVAALCDWIPAWVDRRGGQGGVMRAAAFVAIAALLVATTRISLARYERHRHPVGSGVDGFLADGRGFYVDALLDQLRESIPADATLLVMPEGVMINYLARRRNPTGFINFMPPEILLFGEDRMLEDFERDPPDYVALVQKRTLEYGLPYFGVDYGRDLRAFVDRHYRLVSRIGDVPFTPDTTFGITLHRRVAPKANGARP
jgi:hypothetical protein